MDSCRISSGEHTLFIAGGSAIFLWEMGRERVGPVWWKIFPPDGVLLPDPNCNREAVIDAYFNTHPVSYLSIDVSALDNIPSGIIYIRWKYS